MIYSHNKSQRDAPFLTFILVKNFTCFGQICCPSSGVSTLYAQQQVFVMLVMLTVCWNGHDIVIAVYTVLRLRMMDSRSVRNM
jgi:hypothetical protein